MRTVMQLLNARKNRPKAVRSRNNAIASMPPDYKADPFQNRKFRFNYTPNSSPNALIISRFDLMMMYGIVQTTPSKNFTSAFGAIKLSRVQVWIIGSPGAGALQTMQFSSLTWTSENTPNVEISSAGNLVNPGYITTTPPADSLAGFWTNVGNAGTSSSSPGLFILNIPASTQIVVDISVVYVPCSSGEELYDANPHGGNNLRFSYQPLDYSDATPTLLPVSNIS